MKEGLKVYLFRHGQTTYNRDGRFTGWHNPGLTKLGKEQAQKVALKLKSKKFGVAIHTRLRRSIDTLNIVLKYHPECKAVLIDDRMIERNYGDLNGVLHEDFIRRVGKELYDLEIEGDAVTDFDSNMRKEVARFLGEQEYNVIHRGWNVPPPNGESFAMVERRVESFIKDLTKMMKSQGVNVAISAHGNSIRLFRKVMEKASVKEAVSWVIPYLDYFEYTIK